MALDVLPSRRRRPPPSATTAIPDGAPEMAAFPQRMWVGGRIRETRPLASVQAGAAVEPVSAAEPKDGSSGRFWLVTVEHTITQGGEPCIEEEQDLVLREPSAAADQGAAADDAPVADWVEARTADPALLFRYSALTFNAHRIHYDEPYATAVEGYPDLVVQGPLTATLLCELARVRSGRPVRGLSFRARVPLFANRKLLAHRHRHRDRRRPRRGARRRPDRDDPHRDLPEREPASIRHV